MRARYGQQAPHAALEAWARASFPGLGRAVQRWSSVVFRPAGAWAGPAARGAAGSGGGRAGAVKGVLRQEGGASGRRRTPVLLEDAPRGGVASAPPPRFVLRTSCNPTSLPAPNCSWRQPPPRTHLLHPCPRPRPRPRCLLQDLLGLYGVNPLDAGTPKTRVITGEAARGVTRAGAVVATAVAPSPRARLPRAPGRPPTRPPPRPRAPPGHSGDGIMGAAVAGLAIAGGVLCAAPRPWAGAYDPSRLRGLVTNLRSLADLGTEIGWALPRGRGGGAGRGARRAMGWLERRRPASCWAQQPGSLADGRTCVSALPR
jgi:hypothetical protein